ncbi:MAG: hypothetical protein WC855_11725 [Thermodesulfovibrionales bacterium]
MEETTVEAIRDKLQGELLRSEKSHEAEGWANALKSFMIAVGIQDNLERLPNA